QAIPKHFSRIELDEFIVMPNHIHGILVMKDDDKNAIDDGRGLALPNPYKGQFGKPIAGSLPTIIGSFKSASTKQINILRDSPGTPVWQRNYYDHIIRDEEYLHKIRQYVLNNPLSWEVDQLHPDNPSKW
ncbi:MAG: transposase, partial [Xenococcaceae cyanobacterium]